MIDHLARKRMAELSRQLAIGHITNDEFEDSLLRSKEVGLHEVFFRGLWPLYDDFHKHKLRGKCALSEEGRAWVARIILFLKSNQPYRWPRVTGFSGLPIMTLSLLTLGWFGRMWLRRLANNGDESVWPFFSRRDYEEALKNPLYLTDAQQSTAGSTRETRSP